MAANDRRELLRAADHAASGVPTGWTLNTADGKAARVPIAKRGVAATPMTDHVTMTNGLQDLALSPDGRRLAGALDEAQVGDGDRARHEHVVGPGLLGPLDLQLRTDGGAAVRAAIPAARTGRQRRRRGRNAAHVEREILQRTALQHETESLNALQALWKQEEAELRKRGIKAGVKVVGLEKAGAAR